ncbi:sigma-70 family RNA polymerase sigma factor [Candidatus Poribacteria bacterium]|nr:sigma-70 family RNA polymerase sigma factor [Candidatus Poribacteria bacterium]
MANQATTTDVQWRAKKLTAYIGKMTENRIIDVYRKKRGIEEVPLDDQVPFSNAGERDCTWIDVIPDRGPKVEDVVMGDDQEDANQAQRSEMVKKALSLLTPLQRQVVILRAYEGLSYKEIEEFFQQHPELCQALGLRKKPNQENIKKTYHQAEKALKRHCTQEGSKSE